MYVFYLDVFFALQFVLNTIVLYMSSLILGKGIRIGYYICLSCVYSVISTILLVMVHPYFLYQVIVYVVLIPLLVIFMDRRNTKNEMLSLAITLFGSNLMLSGCLEWLLHQCHVRIVWALVISGIGLLFGLTIHLGLKRCRGECCKAELIYGEQKLIMRGLYDTGNRLVNHQMKPVSLVKKTSIEPILRIYQGKEQLLTYETVAGSGVMKTIEIDKLMTIYHNKQCVIKHAVIGIVDDKNLGKEYQMLVNALHRG